MKKRIVVAMSGGVDSSVTAALLKKQGYEVIGITMCFNLPPLKTKKPTCCGLEAIADAQKVAHRLSIKHYVLNFSDVLLEKVIRDFCQEYLKGRTPNPCVRCNQYIKFGELLKKTKALGVDFLATGHYARIEKMKNAKRPATKYLLKKARDFNKDQSYFLYRLNQNQLRQVLFPLGDYTKAEVRRLARVFDLPVAEKSGSQEICFIPDNDYRAFLTARFQDIIIPGEIVDGEDNPLGKHGGICFYTVGQRTGLGIAKGYPLYVIKIDTKKNQIIVGNKEDAYTKEFLVKQSHFITSPIKNKVVLKVKIRYNHQEAPAEVEPLNRRLIVRFNKPQFAVTPGQSAVFYDHNRVIGGGIIEAS